MKFRLSWKFRIALGVLMVPFFVNADTPPPDQGWAVMASNPTSGITFYGKPDSLKIDADGVKILVQIVQKNEDTVTYSEVSITRSTCKDGYGSMNFKSLSNNRNTQADYVKGGASLGATVGADLCFVLEHEDELRKNNKIH